MNLQEILRETELFKDAKQESIEQLAAVASLKQYKKGKQILWDHEEIHNLYILIRGAASLYKINSIGEKKVIFVYGAGKTLNEEALQMLPSSIHCELKEDSTLIVIPICPFLKVMEQDPKLMRAVVDSMALKIRRLYRQLKNTTNALSGEKRLAAKLYKLARDYGVYQDNKWLIQMNLSITYLADMLGSKRETVSRQAKKLCEMGLIQIEKNQISVLDLEKLSEYFKMS